MLYRKLLPLLLFLSVSVFGEDISKGMVPDVTNPIPLGVIPLFSVPPQTLSEDSINVEYSITNTTFEDTLDVEVLNKWYYSYYDCFLNIYLFHNSIILFICEVIFISFYKIHY